MKDEASEDFGSRLREIRKRLNLKQKDFASAVGLAGSYLSEIESGKIKPGFDFFYKITSIFNINPLFLLHGKEPKFLEKNNINGIKPLFPAVRQENLDELFWYLKHSTMVQYAILEFFTRYKLANKNEIEQNIKELKSSIKDNN